ncbi:MAG TPA: hypothetical protein DCE03_02445 [Synergistaceae bacterium]|nr:hypothetical protein [Synergistaceae bacterium]HAG22935.1 hypothetical protein [Synergistaceae bacterium]
MFIFFVKINYYSVLPDIRKDAGLAFFGRPCNDMFMLFPRKFLVRESSRGTIAMTLLLQEGDWKG